MILSVRTLRARLAGSALILALFAVTASAQKPEARILAPIDNAARVTLSGSHPAALLQQSTDLGRMPATTALQGVSIAFTRSAAQQSALDALLVAQQDPSSPQYHQWLTPDQFAARFGAADADLAKMQDWLQQQGFTVDEVSRNRSVIRFSGSVTQIESAFGTEMHYFNVAGAKHFAPASDLSVPAAFASAVMTVANLTDFRPSSHAKFLAPVRATALFTSGQTSSHYVTPKDVATIYDINAAYNAGWTGSGQTIAVIGQSAVVTGDITNFQAAAGVPVRSPTTTLVPGTGSSQVYTSDEGESDLDLEYTSAIARGATIDFVYTGSSPNYGSFDAFTYAVTQNIAPIISISYGSCELALAGAVSTTAPPLYPTTASSYYAYYNSYAQQAAAQGQTVVAAAGDQGSTDCYNQLYNTSQSAQEAVLAVDFPASSAYVTGMGGSEYLTADVASTNTQYWLSSTGLDATASAISYIPEMAWNDDAANSGLGSGGGGISTQSARPTWQTGAPGLAALTSTFRMVPDISLASSPNNAGYLYCSSDSSSTGITGSCSYGFRDSSDTYLTVAGGTSFAAPIFAGMVAIINQSKGITKGSGLINPTLYTLASNSSTYASAFHDITTGNNGCVSGTAYAVAFNANGSVSAYGPSCPTASGSQYAASTGYDLATGLGSVDLNNLLSAWPGTTAKAPATFALSASAATISAGSSGTATVTVTPANGYTGTVAITLSSNPLINYGCFSATNANVTGTSAATSTVTINTISTSCGTGAVPLTQKGSGASAVLHQPAVPAHSELPAGVAVAGLLALGFMGRRSRRLRGAIAIAVLAVVAGFGLSGCSGTSTGTGVVGTTGGTTTTTGTAAKGTYTITVTGEDTTTGQQATTSFQLTLQ
jgi:subtilase family serine protease